jgi:hypothetical protein
MHGNIDKEGLYQNYEFNDPQGRGFVPRVGPFLVYSVYV